MVDGAGKDSVDPAQDAVAPRTGEAVRARRYDERLAFDRLRWPHADG